MVETIDENTWSTLSILGVKIIRSLVLGVKGAEVHTLFFFFPFFFFPSFPEEMRGKVGKV
jgi:H2-forming N5,N10-methylenetetrahydromethanopterin dehydrogenase-like enzyme